MPVVLAPSEPDLNGEKDVDPLLKIPEQSGKVEVKKKLLSKTSKSLDYEQPIHTIPSTLIKLKKINQI